MKALVFASLLLGLPAAAQAQSVLAENTPITVQTLESMSSKDAHVGDPVRLEVLDDVVVDGAVVIPAGTPAYGEITSAKKNGHFGKSGKLGIEVESVRYGNNRVRLRGERQSHGKGGSTAMIATTALVSPLGLLIHGKSASLPMHTKFIAYVANDVPLASPMIQPLPAPPRRR